MAFSPSQNSYLSHNLHYIRYPEKLNQTPHTLQDKNSEGSAVRRPVDRKAVSGSPQDT